MHFHAPPLLLLAASTSASARNVIRPNTLSVPPTSYSQFPSSTSELPSAATDVPIRNVVPDLTPEEKCALPFNAEDPAVSKDTWENSGARNFLIDFLFDTGVEDWVDNLFQTTIAHGTQGGSTYDCTGFPGGTCDSPGHNACLDYNPPEMFFVHISIANLYNSLVTIHEKMQDAMIVDLALKIKNVVDIFGPPPEDDSTSDFLTSALSGAAAFAGPAAAPLGGVVSLLGMVSSVASSDPTPVEWESELEKSLGEFYDGFSDNLDSTVNAVFGGDFDGLDIDIKNPFYAWADAVASIFGKIHGHPLKTILWILDQFEDGIMLDHKLIDPALQAWSDATAHMIVSMNLPLSYLKT
jgi:hypothetical protein